MTIRPITLDTSARMHALYGTDLDLGYDRDVLIHNMYMFKYNGYTSLERFERGIGCNQTFTNLTNYGKQWASMEIDAHQKDADVGDRIEINWDGAQGARVDKGDIFEVAWVEPGERGRSVRTTAIDGRPEGWRFNWPNFSVIPQAVVPMSVSPLITQGLMDEMFSVVEDFDKDCDCSGCAVVRGGVDTFMVYMADEGEWNTSDHQFWTSDTAKEFAGECVRFMRALVFHFAQHGTGAFDSTPEWRYPPNVLRFNPDEVAVPETEEQMRARIIELERWKAQAEADTVVLFDTLANEANQRRWCSEYDEIVEHRISPKLVALEATSRRLTLTGSIEGVIHIPFRVVLDHAIIGTSGSAPRDKEEAMRQYIRGSVTMRQLTETYRTAEPNVEVTAVSAR